jgi:hypothetical protein
MTLEEFQAAAPLIVAQTREAMRPDFERLEAKLAALIVAQTKAINVRVNLSEHQRNEVLADHERRTARLERVIAIGLIGWGVLASGLTIGANYLLNIPWLRFKR